MKIKMILGLSLISLSFCGFINPPGIPTNIPYEDFLKIQKEMLHKEEIDVDSGSISFTPKITAIDGVPLEEPIPVTSNIDETEIIEEPNIIETTDEFEGDLCMVVIDSDVSNESIKEFKRLFKKIPHTIRYTLIEYNCPIYLGNNGKYTDGHAGQFDRRDDSSMIIGVNTSSVKKVKMATIHEIGHLVDHKAAVETGIFTYDEFYSDCEEFQNIYNEEAPKSGFPSYITSGRWDYFAEVFRYYFEDRSRLDKLPKSKEFMRQFLFDFYGYED